MCGRYILYTSEEYEEILGIIREIESNQLDGYKNMKTGEIYPTDLVPVITKDDKNNNVVNLFKWGFPHFNQSSGVIINARGETLEEKTTFKKSLYTKRCIIPACGFFEWKKFNRENQKYFIRPAENKVFYMAGLYNTFNDKAGTPYNSFVIITTEANEEMAAIHNRMPLIFPSKKEAHGWINNSLNSSEINSYIEPFKNKLYYENQSNQLQFQM